MGGGEGWQKRGSRASGFRLRALGFRLPGVGGTFRCFVAISTSGKLRWKRVSLVAGDLWHEVRGILADRSLARAFRAIVNIAGTGFGG